MPKTLLIVTFVFLMSADSFAQCGGLFANRRAKRAARNTPAQTSDSQLMAVPVTSELQTNCANGQCSMQTNYQLQRVQDITPQAYSINASNVQTASSQCTQQASSPLVMRSQPQYSTQPQYMQTYTPVPMSMASQPGVTMIGVPQVRQQYSTVQSTVCPTGTCQQAIPAMPSVATVATAEVDYERIIAAVLARMPTQAATVGPQGPKGDQGERGPRGIDGQQGPIGPAGKDATISNATLQEIGVQVGIQVVDQLPPITIEIEGQPPQTQNLSDGPAYFKFKFDPSKLELQGAN